MGTDTLSFGFLKHDDKELIVEQELPGGDRVIKVFVPYSSFANEVDHEVLIEELGNGYWIEKDLDLLLEFGSYGQLFSFNEPVEDDSSWGLCFYQDDLFLEVVIFFNQKHLLQINRLEEDALIGNWFSNGEIRAVTFERLTTPIHTIGQLEGAWAIKDSTELNQVPLFPWEGVGDFFPGLYLNFDADSLVFHQHFVQGKDVYDLSPMGTRILSYGLEKPWQGDLLIQTVSDSLLVLDRKRKIPHPDGWWERVELRRVEE